jgi:hypothetical protein
MKNLIKLPKVIGMIHIKGVNDKEWKEFISKQSKTNDKNRFGPGYGSMGLPSWY